MIFLLAFIAGAVVLTVTMKLVFWNLDRIDRNDGFDKDDESAWRNQYIREPKRIWNLDQGK